MPHIPGVINIRLAFALASLALAAACGEPQTALEPVTIPEEVSPHSPPVAGDIPVGGEGWAVVSVGTAHSCALTLMGEAFCWGESRSAQIGVASAPDICGPPATPCARLPLRVATTHTFSRISAGGSHSCAIDNAGEAFCWGNNTFGQLGVPSPRIASEPIAVSGGHRFREISAGESHTCGLRVDGTVLCWGRNENGELGRGNSGASSVPMAARPAPAFEQIASGAGRTCATTSSGEAYCWGRIWLYTQGGLEWSRRQQTPQLVPGDVALRGVSVGSLSTCGIGPNDTPYCWEANGFGQLGIGRLSGNETPVAIASPEPYRSISVGSIQTCAISSDYRARCWGNNTFGQLGNHSVRATCLPSGLPCAPRPVGVRGTLRFMSLATGLGNHVCGVTTATNLYCWGLGNNGQLGDGDSRTVLRYEPTRVITPLQIRAAR